MRKLEIPTFILGDDFMLAELRQKSQITKPKELIAKLSLSEGDKLDVFEKDGTICMMLVAVYPKNIRMSCETRLMLQKLRLHLGSSLFLTMWMPCLLNWRQIDDLSVHIFCNCIFVSSLY